MNTPEQQLATDTGNHRFVVTLSRGGYVREMTFEVVAENGNAAIHQASVIAQAGEHWGTDSDAVLISDTYLTDFYLGDDQPTVFFHTHSMAEALAEPLTDIRSKSEPIDSFSYGALNERI